jgi:hypothetical protein
MLPSRCVLPTTRQFRTSNIPPPPGFILFQVLTHSRVAMQTFLAQQCFQSGRAAFIGAGWAPTFLVGVARQCRPTLARRRRRLPTSHHKLIGSVCHQMCLLSLLESNTDPVRKVRPKGCSPSSSRNLGQCFFLEHPTAPDGGRAGHLPTTVMVTHSPT